MKMTQDTDVLKEDNAELLAILKEMLTAVREAAHQGTAMHEVERAVWQQVLLIGRAALSQFLTLLGPGDMGESVTLPGGQVCQRLEETHSRRYVSIFGEFVLKRGCTAAAKGRRSSLCRWTIGCSCPRACFLMCCRIGTKACVWRKRSAKPKAPWHACWD